MARPPARTGFQPVFTVLILYFAAFFIGFALLLILPEMLDAAARLPPGADPEVEGARVAQAAAASHLLEAFLLATVTLVIGAYYQVLPGIRPRA
jgi:hypothetical protein